MNVRKTTPGQRVTEPYSTHIVAHLGMTKGALIAFVLVFAVFLYGGFRLESLVNQNRKRIAQIEMLQKQQEATQATLGRLVAQGVAAHEVECAQQKNLRQLVRDTVAFLNAINSGQRPPIQGVSQADFLLSIQRTQKALVAYDKLVCD